AAKYSSGCGCRFFCRNERRERRSKKCCHGSQNASFSATGAGSIRTPVRLCNARSDGRSSPLRVHSSKRDRVLFDNRLHRNDFLFYLNGKPQCGATCIVDQRPCFLEPCIKLSNEPSWKEPEGFS